AAIPDVEAVEGVVENRQPDAKQFQTYNEGEAGEQFHLLGVGCGAARGKGIRDEVLDQEGANRDDPAERMSAAQEKRMSLTGPQGSNAFVDLNWSWRIAR